MEKKKKVGKSKDGLQESKIREEHKLILDEYFSNGFNGTQAVLTVNPSMDYQAANVKFQGIQANVNNKAYLEDKRARLRASTDIRNENVLKELIQWAYCDITDFMGLTETEIKELPPDVRRCIQSFKVQEKRTITRDGRELVNRIIEIKIVDKQKALEQISKHIGFFLEDNNQKKQTINLTKIDAGTLNMLLQATEQEY